MNRMAGCIAASLCLAILASGCDPGFYYRPVGWNQVGEARWAWSTGGLDLETGGFLGLDGSSGWSVEVTIRNRSAKQAVVTGAELRTKSGDFQSLPVSDEQTVYRTVVPGESKRITLSFRFDRPLKKIVVDPVRLTLHVEFGEEATAIPIELVRE